jgi:Phosphoribosylaminoimidazolesuccinocarboxamide (SAICAR) synthase
VTPPPGAAEALKHLYSGKVREVYQLPGGPLLLVATDRISAYDYVLPTLIPDKGKILTQLSLWWFGRLADLVPITWWTPPSRPSSRAGPWPASGCR